MKYTFTVYRYNIQSPLQHMNIHQVTRLQCYNVVGVKVGTQVCAFMEIHTLLYFGLGGWILLFMID